MQNLIEFLKKKNLGSVTTIEIHSITRPTRNKMVVVYFRSYEGMNRQLHTELRVGALHLDNNFGDVNENTHMSGNYLV